MATLSQILGLGDPYQQKTIGQVGSWINPQTGVGYSGPKQKETDQAYNPSSVGQQAGTTKQPVPIAPQQQYQPPQQQYQPQGQPIPAMPQPSQPQEPDPLTKFNMAIMDMLQKAQSGGQAGNEALFSQQTALQRAQLGRVSEITPEEMRVLSPSQQSSIRSGEAGQFSPEIDAISSKIKAQDMRLQNFESILGQMREVGADIASLNPSKEVLEGYKKYVEKGGSIAGIPDPTIRNKVAGMVDWDLAEKNRLQAIRNEAAIGASYSGGSGSGLTPAQINSTVNSVAGAFDNEPIVKDFNQATSQYQLMSSLGTQGKSPGDDIAFVYAFAKLMDPNSVVREGEYATIQRYAQSLLDAKTLQAIRTVQNTNFLSADAKQKLLTTAAAKLKVLESQYNNISSEYQRQINDAYAGKPRQITQYSQQSLLQNEALKQKVESYGYDYDALRADGYSDEEIKRSIENELNMSISWQ